MKLIFLFPSYLQEIGYTDTIIDVRSNRVRSLLGLNNNTDSDDMNTPALNGNEPLTKKRIVRKQRRAKKVYQRFTVRLLVQLTEFQSLAREPISIVKIIKLNVQSWHSLLFSTSCCFYFYFNGLRESMTGRNES